MFTKYGTDEETFYHWESSTMHGYPLYARTEHASLTITNGGEWDVDATVTLDTNDQLALLFILADRFGVKIEGA